MRPFHLTDWTYLKYLIVAWLLLLAWGGSFAVRPECGPIMNIDYKQRDITDPLGLVTD